MHSRYAENRQRYVERRGKGICTNCTKPAVRGQVLCEDHRVKVATYNSLPHVRKRRAKWMRINNAERVSRGLCSMCDAIVESGHSLCSEHLKKQHVKSLKRLYGLTREEHAALLVEQHGLCAICQKKERLDIDHNHSLNTVRGLLCRKCNLALGLFGDSLKILQSAVKYFERFEDVNVW